MPTIPTVCEFETSADQVKLLTRTNGDKVVLQHMHLGEDAAAALAYMINTEGNLQVRIRKA